MSPRAQPQTLGVDRIEHQLLAAGAELERRRAVGLPRRPEVAPGREPELDLRPVAGPCCGSAGSLKASGAEHLERRRCARRFALLPANTAAADLVQRHAAIQRRALGELRQHRVRAHVVRRDRGPAAPRDRPAAATRSEPDRGGRSRGEDAAAGRPGASSCPPSRRRTPPGRRRRRDARRDSPGTARVRPRTWPRRALRPTARPPAARAAVGMKQVEGLDLPAARRRAPRRRSSSCAVRETRPEARKAADLAKAAAVGGGGDLDQPRAGPASRPSTSARSPSAPARPRPPRRGRGARPTPRRRSRRRSGARAASRRSCDVDLGDLGEPLQRVLGEERSRASAWPSIRRPPRPSAPAPRPFAAGLVSRRGARGGG